MKYLLYLKRSLLRRPKQHLSLFIILTCAFILPLLISIYRDSSAYGRQQERLYMSKGESFHILNAAEADAAFFEDIEGLSSPRYEDGVIYLRILSEEEWKDIWAMSRYDVKLRERIDESNNPNLYIRGYDYNMGMGIVDESTNSEQSALLILNILIIVLSSFVVGSAYKSHIKRFSSDMAVLRSCGAENRQINTIFLAEFVVIFAISALCAVLISAGVMKLLFVSYLEIRDSEGLAWLIFKMSPANTTLHIAIFFAVLLIVIFRTLIKSGRESTVSAMRGDIQSSEMSKKPRRLKIKSTAEKTLTSLWRSRTNKTHRSCLAVIIPVMTVFLFLFSYLSLDIAFITEPPEYELMFSKNAFNFGGFTQEDIDFVRSLTQVDTVNCRQDAPTEAFNQEAGGLFIDVMDIKLTSPGLHRETEALLNEHFSGAEYEIHNYQAGVEEGQEMSTGIYLMLIFIFAAMFAFVMIIVYMKLRDYIEDSRKTVKTLSTIGAPNGVITSSYIRQSAVSAVIAVVASSIASVVLFLLAAIPAAQKPEADLPLILTYLAVGALTVCSFTLPVYHSLKVILEKKRS